MTTTDERTAHPAWRFESLPGWVETVSYAVRASISSETSTVDVWDEVYGKSPRLQLAPAAARTLAAALVEAADLLEAAQR